MVSGLGSARGEVNHTERSHYFLQTFIEQYIGICTAWQNTSHHTSTQVVTDTSVPTIEAITKSVSGSIPVHFVT